MSPETRNLIAAMSLSLAILIGWQLYFVEPELEAQRATYNEQAAQQSELPQPSGQQTGQSGHHLASWQTRQRLLRSLMKAGGSPYQQQLSQALCQRWARG